MQQNGLILDFTQTPVAVHKRYSRSVPCTDHHIALAHIVPIYDMMIYTQNPANPCMTQSCSELETDVVYECAIPDYKGTPQFELHKCNNSQLKCIL